MGVSTFGITQPAIVHSKAFVTAKECVRVLSGRGLLMGFAIVVANLSIYRHWEVASLLKRIFVDDQMGVSYTPLEKTAGISEWAVSTLPARPATRRVWSITIAALI
jgi:hypothetical protein